MPLTCPNARPAPITDLQGVLDYAEAHGRTVSLDVAGTYPMHVTSILDDGTIVCSNPADSTGAPVYASAADVLAVDVD